MAVFGGDAGNVTVLGIVKGRAVIERLLDGWAEFCGYEDSLVWVLRRVHDCGLAVPAWRKAYWCPICGLVYDPARPRAVEDARAALSPLRHRRAFVPDPDGAAPRLAPAHARGGRMSIPADLELFTLAEVSAIAKRHRTTLNGILPPAASTRSRSAARPASPAQSSSASFTAV